MGLEGPLFFTCLSVSPHRFWVLRFNSHRAGLRTAVRDPVGRSYACCFTVGEAVGPSFKSSMASMRVQRLGRLAGIMFVHWVEESFSNFNYNLRVKPASSTVCNYFSAVSQPPPYAAFCML